MQINTLADLLNLDINNLSLSNTTITFDKKTNTAQVTGTATILGMPDQKLSAKFSVADGQLLAEPQVTLTSITLQKLADLNALPVSAYKSTDLPNIAFTDVSITADPQTRFITFVGTGPSGNLPLGITALPMTGTALYLKTRLASDNQTTQSQAAYISGTLQIGQGMDVHLNLPTGYLDWSLQSVNTAPATLTNGLADVTALTGKAVAPILPANMPGISHFALSRLAVQFNSVTQTIASVQFSISTTDTWTIVSGSLAVTSVVFSLSFNKWGSGTNAFWQIGGGILGTIELFDVECQISIPLPPSASDWVLSTTPNVTIPGLGDLANELSTLIGAGDLSASLPPGLDTLGEIAVEFVEIVFNPSGASAADVLKNVSFRLTNENGWSLPYATSVQLTNILIDLNIAAPFGSSEQRIVTGSLGGAIYINQFYVPLLIQRPTSESTWTMTIAYPDIEVGLPDLISIAGLDGAALQKALPPSLSIVNDLALTSLEVEYDISLNALEYVAFTLGLTDPWKIIDGYLEVTDLGLSAEYYQLLDTTNWQYLIFISATLEIVDVVFFISAGNFGDAGDWTLTGELGAGQSINLNDLINWLLQKLLAADFKLPASFPTVTVTQMALSLTPATAAFNAALTSNVSWDIPFSQARFKIEDLSTVIDIGAAPTPPATGDRPYTFSASGKFTLASLAYLTGTATFITSSGASPTIITVEVVATDQIQGADLVNAIIAPTVNNGNTVKAWDQLPVPSDYTKPNYIVQAGLQLNLTANTFLAHGAFTLPTDDPNKNLYGAVALLVVQQTDKSYSYAVAAMLKNWTFAQLSAALAVIDGIFTVSEAAVLLSDLDAEQIAPLPAFVPAIGNALGNKRGLNFYATLELGSGLLAQVGQLLGITTQGPFAVKGYIAADALQSEFEATLGGLTLLNFLSFNNIVLKYAVQQAKTFTLTGDIVVTVNATPYTFNGDLSVVRTELANQPASTTASAHIVSAQAITSPLDIPKLEISALFFDFYYTFDGSQSDNQYMLGGTVKFSDVVSMSGLIYFKNNAPAVVYIKLDDLDIGVFFQKLFNLSWSLFTFRLKNGMLYYAPDAASLTLYDSNKKTTSQLSFLKGFYASTDIDIFFIKDFHIDVTIGDAGIIATGSLATPIDWGFIQFYRGPSTNPALPSDPTKGPLVAINSGTSTFTLSGGFGLFGTPIASLLMNVKSSAIDGLIALDQTVGIFGKPSFNFTWDDKNGFQVKNWSLPDFKLPDFEFHNIQLEGDCPLSGIVSVPIRSKVDITPSFSIKMVVAAGQTVATPHLDIAINGTLNLVVNSSAYPDALLSAPFIDAHLLLSFPATGFTWDTLANSFVDCIKSAASSIFETLIKKPENLAKLLAVEGLVWSATQLKNFLLCAWEDAVTEAVIAEFIEAAAGAVAVTIIGLITGGIGILVGGIVGSIDSNGDHHNNDGGGHHDNKPPRPNAPAAPTLSYANGKLTVAWQRVDNAEYYSAVIKQDGNAFAQTNATKNLSVPVDASDGHTYSAQIVASGAGGTSDAGASTSLTVLGHVDMSDFYAVPGQVVVSWRAAVQGASGYMAQLVDASHQPILQSPPVTLNQPGALSLTADLPATLSPGLISIAVQAASSSTNPVAGNIVYPATSILCFAPPIISGLSFSDQQVTITLQANIPQATGYNVQFLDAANNNQEVGERIHVAVTAQATVIVPVTGIPSGTYALRIQTVGAARTTIPSAWAVSSTSVLVAGSIALNSLRYLNGNLTADWSGNHLVDKYTLELHSATGLVLSDSVERPTPQTPAPTSLSISIPVTVARGLAYTGYLYVTVNSLTGPKSVGVVVVLLDVPQGLVLSYTGTQLHARWQAVDAAGGYTVKLEGASLTEPRSTSTPVGPMPPDTLLTLNIDGLAAGLYTATMQATANQLAGEWSSPPVAVALLAAPEITSIAYAENFVTLNWSVIAQAESYHVQLSDGVKPVALAETLKVGVTPPETQTRLDVTLLAKGAVYTASVNAGIGAGVGAWSESKPILAMDVPTLTSATYQTGDKLQVVWKHVDGATAYSFKVLTGNGNPTSLVIPPVSASADESQTNTIDVSTLTDGTYSVQMMATNGALQTAWSAGLSFTIQRLTPDILATQLYAAQVIAPNAAPQIVAAFHDPFATDASLLIKLLQAHFPESTKSLTQLAWVLAKAGYTANLATQTLAAQPNAQLSNVLAAVKAAYPAPAVQQQITQLLGANSTAQDAAQQIHTAHTDLDTLQMGVLLAINFASTLETPIPMAQALHQAGYDGASVLNTLSQVYPLNSLADLVAVIRSVYPAT